MTGEHDQPGSLDRLPSLGVECSFPARIQADWFVDAGSAVAAEGVSLSQPERAIVLVRGPGRASRGGQAGAEAVIRQKDAAIRCRLQSWA